MINALAFLSVTTSVMWALTPRFFLLCDVLVTRQRLQKEHGTAGKTPSTVEPARPAQPSRSTQLTNDFLTARHFNELARLTRAHVPLRDALSTISTAGSSHEWLFFIRLLENGSTIDDAFRQYLLTHRPTLALQLLRASVSHGSFVPSALDQAALLLRDDQRTKGDIAVAAAQAQLTMRMLSHAPFAIMVLALFVSESFRHIIASPGVLFVCGIALLLNRAGAKWTALLIRRLDRPTPIDELLHLAAVLTVHVRTGHSLPSACQRLLGTNSLGDCIAASLQQGESFENSLAPLRHHRDQFGEDVATILISAYRDGQPALETIGAITNEARSRREQHTQVLIRQLPTQLTAPVVLCALPSFILLVVVPLMIAQFSTLSGSLAGSPS